MSVLLGGIGLYGPTWESNNEDGIYYSAGTLLTLLNRETI